MLLKHQEKMGTSPETHKNLQSMLKGVAYLIEDEET